MNTIKTIFSWIYPLKTYVVEVKDKFVKEVDELEDMYVILTSDKSEALHYTWMSARKVARSHFGKISLA